MRQLPGFGRGGVDVFFVISGFIMVHVNKGRERSPGRFMMQRIARIAPFYWTMTLIVFAVAAANPALVSSTTASTSDLARSLLFVPFVKGNGLIEPTLFVGWTLNYEMFFYAAFAVGLLLRNERSGVVLTGLILAGFILLGRTAAPDAIALQFYGSPVSLEFLAGMILGVILGGPPPQPLCRTNPAWLLMAATAALCCRIVDPLVFTAPGWILCGVPAVVLVLCALRLERGGWVVRHPVAVTLGNASFAIYLTHPFAIRVVHKIAAFVPSAPYFSAVTIVSSFLTTIAVGIATYRWLERPLSSAARSIVRTYLAGPRAMEVQERT